MQSYKLFSFRYNTVFNINLAQSWFHFKLFQETTILFVFCHQKFSKIVKSQQWRDIFSFPRQTKFLLWQHRNRIAEGRDGQLVSDHDVGGLQQKEINTLGRFSTENFLKESAYSSGDLNNGLIWYSEHWNFTNHLMAHYLDHHLNGIHYVSAICMVIWIADNSWHNKAEMAGLCPNTNKIASPWCKTSFKTTPQRAGIGQ